MKSKQIAQVIPHLHDGHLIIVFDQRWIEIFNEIPIFDVIIDENNKLNLCSMKPVRKIRKVPTQLLEEITI